MKRVLIAGASGMVGTLVLKKCLESDDISEVISIGRKYLGIKHEKLIEVSHNNFTNFVGIEKYFENIDIAFFCIGVYTGIVDRRTFRQITIDFPEAFGKMLKAKSSNTTFCLLSGMGADSQEKSKVAFALDKGIAENKIINMKFPQTYLFRPGYIFPIFPREEPNLSYRFLRRCYPLMKFILPKSVITSAELATIMFKIGMKGYKKSVLENFEMKEML